MGTQDVRGVNILDLTPAIKWRKNTFLEKFCLVCREEWHIHHKCPVLKMYTCC